MQPTYLKFVSEHARLLREGIARPEAESLPEKSHRALSPDAPKAIIFAPHPDDESIVGGLALRLLRELKTHVINVAVTLGSRKDRRDERLEELEQACRHLGFELYLPQEEGLEQINLHGKEQSPENWHKSVNLVSEILCRHKPQVVFFPHAADANSTHAGVNSLLNDALQVTNHDFCCWVCETEFWAPLKQPNLLVESSIADVADLLTALACHAGEIKRNPYHLRLPAWMIDNVRRGAELVRGQGCQAPSFTFATLYRLTKWRHGRYEDTPDGKIISADDSLAGLFG